MSSNARDTKEVRESANVIPMLDLANPRKLQSLLYF